MKLHKLTNKPTLAVVAVLAAVSTFMGGFLWHAQIVDRQPTQSNVSTGAAQSHKGYVSVNGLKMFYEIHGTGKPLVLLHGALSTTDTDFGKVLPALAKTRRVISIEQQAHGHTADADRPLSYEQMGDDTVALLEKLNVKNADFFGYSMGGGIALQVAMRYPDMVRKLVIMSGVNNNDGYYPEILQGEMNMKPEDLAGSPFQKAYAKTAPDPENWPALIDKVKDLDLNFAGWPPEAIQAIKAPALLIIGDSDVVRPEHAVQMFRLFEGGEPSDLTQLPDSQLAVLPATTHITIVSRADWLLPMIMPFLNAPMPKTE
ncbi:MAG: alpha/beta hydrolase [Patescibacteria group bacterium]